MTVEHILKTHPAYFDAIERGDKTFEVRRDDRGFQKGDVLVLQRTREDRTHDVDWDPHHKPKLGDRMRARKELRRRIGYILTGGQFGIEPGHVVMQLVADK